MSRLLKRSNRIIGKCSLAAGMGFAVALILERVSGRSFPDDAPNVALPPCFLLAGAFAVLSMVGAYFRHRDSDGQ